MIGLLRAREVSGDRGFGERFGEVVVQPQLRLARVAQRARAEMKSRSDDLLSRAESEASRYASAMVGAEMRVRRELGMKPLSVADIVRFRADLKSEFISKRLAEIPEEVHVAEAERRRRGREVDEELERSYSGARRVRRRL